MANEPLIINGFDTGIADSPHKGFGLLKLVDIDRFPGAVSIGKKLASLFPTALSATVTVDAGTDIFTIASGTVPVTGYPVKVSTTGVIPTGILTTSVYFVIRLSSTTFKLASSVVNANASTALNITDAGTGTHTVVTVNPQIINHIIEDKRSGVIFFQDSNGYVWYLTSGSSNALLLHQFSSPASNAKGNGIALLLTSDSTATWLFAFRNNVIDVINVFGTTQLEDPFSNWTTSWQTLNTASTVQNRHKTIYAQDNIIYYPDGQYVGSIRELPNQVFDPSNAATYRFTKQALDLPSFEIANDIEELGVNLLIAGNTFDKIYPWNRISDSFDLPLTCPEKSIKRLKNIGNIVYITAGTEGNIYKTQGSYIDYFTRIPIHLTDNLFAGGATTVTWGCLEAVNGALLVGVGANTAGNSGLYKIWPDGRMILEQIPSSGSANVISVLASNRFYYIGYSGGADYHTGALYSGGEGVVQSPFYRVATKTGKAKYSEVEMVLGATTGASVVISYRTALTASWTTLATFTIDGTNTNYKADAGLIDIENIQIQAEIDGTGSGHDVELLEIRLIP